MGDVQRRAGSIQPTEAPAFMQPKKDDAPSLRGPLNTKNAEALYVPAGGSVADLTPQERWLHETVERYNVVNDFLNKLESPELREFAWFV